MWMNPNDFNYLVSLEAIKQLEDADKLPSGDWKVKNFWKSDYNYRLEIYNPTTEETKVIIESWVSK